MNTKIILTSVIAVACLGLGAYLFCHNTKTKGESVPKVYFTKTLTPEKLIDMYEIL